MADFKDKSWTCTDPDNQQYGRQISEKMFEFKERGEEILIDLESYSIEEIKSHISAYYESFKELRGIYGEKSDWIIAECIFEQESGLY